MFFSNTQIPYGKLKESHLEKFMKAYEEIGLNSTSSLPSIDSINEDNKKLREFEITPNPHGDADNKLIIGIKYSQNGNLSLHVKISPGENSIKNPKELIINYEKIIRSYCLD